MKRTLVGVVVLFVVSAAAVVGILDRVAPSGSPKVSVSTPASSVETADAFPWTGEFTLVDETGQRLSWKVLHLDGEVHLVGVHPHWRVLHRAKPDGTPLFTEKQFDGQTTRVTWRSDGARIDHLDGAGKASSVTIHELGLWDGSTAVARLAGLRWALGKQVRLRIADLNLADGTVYPMIAEYVRQERCGEADCHRVHFALDDFRRLVSPTNEFYFATAPGSSLLQYDGEGFTFHVPGR